MPGIYYLRDVVDADKLVAAIAELKKTDGKARAKLACSPTDVVALVPAQRCRLHNEMHHMDVETCRAVRNAVCAR